MPRPVAIERDDPAVLLRAERLAWAFQHKGIPQKTLAERVTQRLKARRGKRPGLSIPDSVTGAAIHHWRKGNRRTCRTSVLTALATELGVSADFLRADREEHYLRLPIRLPGVRGSVPIEVTLLGWVGRHGNWVSGGEQETPGGDPRRLAGLWTDMGFWRAALLENLNHFDDERDDACGAPVAFFEHMAAALGILLAPLRAEGRLKGSAVGTLLGLWNPEVGRLWGEGARGGGTRDGQPAKGLDVSGLAV